MDSDFVFADAYVEAPNYPLNEQPVLPPGLAGMVLFGPDAKSRRAECYRWDPQRWWQYSEGLDRIVSESNARFPSRGAQIVDLEIDPHRLMKWLERPSEWWPLCESLRGTSRMLRLHLPAGTESLVGVKKLVTSFPHTTFWLDPFLHGPSTGWQGHVRLATYANVVISTLGLIPMEYSLWAGHEAQEALRFTVGEVGAGVLVYASGLSWDELCFGRDSPYKNWILQTPHLDEEERHLVLMANAKRVFSNYKESSSLGLA